ncbi:MoeA, N-terminal and linker domain-containing protein [Triangularia verruculosa]|uniref:molybdopterin adenylyltransferase n=1 Tax=Triangularia verruculosa TaxID=2587418 RepID=A0AAN7AWT5_9PEZI|nr:MoeA, N-terminal and linker domain-containing protein [Triangularia verruculosa]
MAASKPPPSSPQSYAAALEAIEKIATDQRNGQNIKSATVPLEHAVGRTAACDHTNPESTPKYDTSAMDGYAIRSAATKAASPDTPVMFQIKGTIAAGDDLSQVLEDLDNTNLEVCVEIMTGGIFPPQFDACVKLEDVTIHQGQILVTKPLPPNTNKRLAGSDIPRGSTVLKAGEVIQLPHILPLASTGFTSVTVARQDRVGVFSTGKELLQGRANDINGPYLTAAAKDAGANVDFLGIIGDEPAELHRRLAEVVDEGYDVVITSGAVSKGRYDHIRDVLEKMGAEILFHGLAIRPGHPVLLAFLTASTGRKVAFFGLPGNPGAAATYFRFLVVPYLRRLRGQERERFMPATLMNSSAQASKAKPQVSCKALDCFRHGVLSVFPDGRLGVEVSLEQSPAKLAPYRKANCWVHFESQHGDFEPSELEIVKCYPFSPPANLLELVS